MSNFDELNQRVTDLEQKLYESDATIVALRIALTCVFQQWPAQDRKRVRDELFAKASTLDQNVTLQKWKDSGSVTFREVIDDLLDG